MAGKSAVGGDLFARGGAGVSGRPQAKKKVAREICLKRKIKIKFLKEIDNSSSLCYNVSVL